MKKITITIDGWSSCGKSTLARQLAKELGYVYVDSGAMYRAITLYFLRHHIDWTDKKEVTDALKNINLEIERGEIFALLGPNGAGKTTLISIICGIVNATSGQVLADGHDISRDYRKVRSMIGLVPQELATDAFETVLATVTFSRGLFGKPRAPDYIEKVLRPAGDEKLPL